MSDDPSVTVPAELVDALRQSVRAWGNDIIIGDSGLLAAARALVDATERPAANQNCRVCQGYTHPLDEHATGCPAAPVSEPLCRCGHTAKDHVRVMVPATCTQCGCNQFTPPPVPVSDEAVADQDNGQANTCRHLSASGMDTSSGPGKVWRCDHCGLCWIEGYSPHGFRAGRGEAKP